MMYQVAILIIILARKFKHFKMLLPRKLENLEILLAQKFKHLKHFWRENTNDFRNTSNYFIILARKFKWFDKHFKYYGFSDLNFPLDLLYCKFLSLARIDWNFQSCFFAIYANNPNPKSRNRRTLHTNSILKKAVKNDVYLPWKSKRNYEWF